MPEVENSTATESVRSEEQAILARLRTDDKKAWRDLYRLYDPLINKIVRWSKWRFEHHTAEDLSQNIRRDLHQALLTVSGVLSLKQFVRTLAVRRCIDEVRKQVRARQTFVSPVTHGEDGEWVTIEHGGSDELDPRREILREERAMAVRGLVDQMDETCRVAVKQFYVEELSYRDMASRLGITVNTVGSRLAKCLAKLRRMAMTDDFLREDFPEWRDSSS